MEIIKENGKIWAVEKELAYGVWHFKKAYLGEYQEEEKPKEEKKKNKKGEEK